MRVFKGIDIFLSLFTVLIIILIPFSFLAFEVTQQGYSLYNSLSGDTIKGELFGLSCISSESMICSLINKAERFSTKYLSKFGFDTRLEDLLLLLQDKISNFVFSIPILIAEIFLTFIIAFFILKDWENILKKITDLIPMRTKTKNRLISEFGNITHTVIYAQLFVAFVQGVVGTIGFYLLGVPFPMFLGVVMAFCALIPNVGTSLVWVPTSAFLMLTGYFSNNTWILIKGIFLFFYGMLVISTIDNVLLAKIVQSKAKVSPILVIIGVIGGATMFGLPGIFIGPILLTLLIVYFETFKERFN